MKMINIKLKSIFKRQIELEQQKDIANLFGVKSNIGMLDMKLEKDIDYINLAKLVSTKISISESRKQITLFFTELLGNLEKVLKNDDILIIQNKTTVIINGKIKESKGKVKKEKNGYINRTNNKNRTKKK